MIAFRLDANSSVATGHMHRCVSIAKECRKKGAECIFLLATSDYVEILDNEGFQYRVLEIKWDDWNYGIDIVQQCLKEISAECLVVDSYRVTNNFFSELIKEIPIFYLDDLCVQAYDLSAVLHYSEWEHENIVKKLYKNTNVKVFSGMSYMPLREVFAKSSYNTEKRYKILITTGGSDTYHISLKLLSEMISDCVLRTESICMVLGKMNPDKEEIYRIGREYSNVTVLHDISTMDEVMQESCYAVTAGGTTVYELMASGVPFVCFGFSEDQKYFGERLDKYGNAVWAGDARIDADKVVENIIFLLKQLLGIDSDSRQRLIQKNRELIDGKGASRVAGIIIDLCKIEG